MDDLRKVNNSIKLITGRGSFQESLIEDKIDAKLKEMQEKIESLLRDQEIHRLNRGGLSSIASEENSEDSSQDERKNLHRANTNDKVIREE